MRSRLLASSALALGLLLSACGAGAAPAFSVGDEDFSNQALDDDVEAMLARPAFFANVFGVCPTLSDPTDTTSVCPEASTHAGGTYPQAVASFAIRQRIFFTQVKQELARRGLAPTAEDEAFVDDAFSQAGPDGRTFLELMFTDDSAADEEFVNLLIDDFSSQVALQNQFPDEASFSAFIAEANADVEVNARYGTWDPTTGALEPPAGSTSPDAPAGFPT
jgi:hypothetical protein